MTPQVRICHLYPELLNLYGDRGNVLVLARRAMWRGIEAEVQGVTLGDTLRPEDFDIFFLGGGPDQSQSAVAKDFQAKGEALRRATEMGKVLLTICGGYQLLGRYYRTRSGEEIPGTGLFDAYTEAGAKRLRGNVAITMPGLAAGAPPVVGFENHSGRTFLADRGAAAGRVIFGFGNNGEDGTEGCRVKNAFGTYLHGPLLAKNPHLADYLLALAVEQRGEEPFVLGRLNDALELAANRAVVERFGRDRSSA